MERPHSAASRARLSVGDAGQTSATRSASEPDEGEAPGLDAEGIERLRRELSAWRSGPVADASRRFPPRLERFSTWSDLEVPDLATPADVRIDYARDLGFPGQYPFTRGVQPTMYRG